MKAICYILFFFISITLKAQLFEAKIINEKTFEPLESAIIFNNKTLNYTTSDKTGKFSLSIKNYKGIDIVVTKPGYHSLVINDTLLQSLDSLVKLKKREVIIEDIQVIDEDTRKAYISSFEEVFLGKSSFGKKCEILNTVDLVFSFNSDRNTLRAYSQRPLVVHNRALGYFVMYTLVDFRLSENKTSIDGYLYFVEDSKFASGEYEKILENRSKSYFGSEMHFFRSLVSNTLNEEGYTLSRRNNAVVLTKLIQLKDDKTIINSKEWITVSYLSKIPRYLFYTSGKAIIYPNGFHTSNMYIHYTSNKTDISELLPYDYLP